MADEVVNPEEQMTEIEQTLEQGVDIDSPEVTAKLEALKKALGVANVGDDAVTAVPEAGEDVDWSKYDLDPRFAHLYPSSRLDVSTGVPRWLVEIVEFRAVKDRFDTIGMKVTQIVNGPEGWRLQSAVVPVNSNTGVVTLQRKFNIQLPTPNLLKTEEDVHITEMTPEQLAALEKQGLEWAGNVTEPAPVEPATPAIATFPTNEVAQAIDNRTREVEARDEFQPSRDTLIPGARDAAREFGQAQRERYAADPDRPND